ncbi:uncharacterized protein LOC122557548 [Chiloscyllium plagiosum]|uniref:uncharacterized protein LOC122557548 n=1 Tax=Chiloscyllium plagiosum TaxID=36176 RepID=UPI001CB7BC96|nr:uncharacterized protein LOC122557548 [Chiloscyllium plagiosum]
MEGKTILLPHSTHSLELQPRLDKDPKIHQGDASKDITTAEVVFGASVSRPKNEPLQLLQNMSDFGAEENVTFITESMSVTTADEEKLLLLNRNTELRRLNKELMKLNQDWDQIYRATTTGLQQRVAALQMEISDTNQHANALSKKLDNEQEDEPWRPIPHNEKSNYTYPQSRSEHKDITPSSPKRVQISEKPRDHSQCRLIKAEAARHPTKNGVSEKECKELQDQMLALVCQRLHFWLDVGLLLP